MNFDDDAPPDLVETSVDTVDEERVVKVPITIVTGMYLRPMETGLLLTAMGRVFGGWEDNTLELYPDSSTWQEDSCHNERVRGLYVVSLYCLRRPQSSLNHSP